VFCSINGAMSYTAANLTGQTYAASSGSSDSLAVGVAGAATNLSALTGFESITLAGSTDTTLDAVTIANGAGTSITATGAVGVKLGNGGQIFSGSAGADIITGGSGNDDITGGNGADTIKAAGGQDTIHLADSDNAVDVVILNSALNANADTILGFVSGQDVIQFARAALGLNTADYTAGAVTAITAAGAAALGAGAWNNHVVIDTSANIATLVIGAGSATGAVLAVASDTGQIYFDADGNFSAGAVLIGTAVNVAVGGDLLIV
jgi:Ca2+-binding RTX toxin-like protein